MSEGGAPFHVRVAEVAGGVVVSPAGDLDLATVPTLIKEAQRLIRGAPATMTVDMSGVDFCDSAGINGLVTLRNASQEAGWRFEVANLRGHVHYVIVELTGLGEFLGVSAAHGED